MHRHLLVDLLTIMPLQAHRTVLNASSFLNLAISESGEYSFPNNAEKQALMASALGLLVRFIQIMSKYLGVTLLYEMRFRGAESVIWREGSSCVIHSYVSVGPIL
jgi:hypothetical protein